jgi:hypothetical protein
MIGFLTDQTSLYSLVHKPLKWFSDKPLAVTCKLQQLNFTKGGGFTKSLCAGKLSYRLVRLYCDDWNISSDNEARCSANTPAFRTFRCDTLVSDSLSSFEFLLYWQGSGIPTSCVDWTFPFKSICLALAKTFRSVPPPVEKRIKSLIPALGPL